jgi:hypothetical protein
MINYQLSIIITKLFIARCKLKVNNQFFNLKKVLETNMTHRFPHFPSINPPLPVPAADIDTILGLHNIIFYQYQPNRFELAHSPGFP